MGYIHEQYRDLDQTATVSERNFGYTLSTVLFLFAVIYSKYILLAAAAPLAIVTILFPYKLKTLSTYWTSLSNILQKISTPIIMVLIYTLVFLPIAIVLNICRKNTMLNYDTTVKTYWIPKDPPELSDPMKYQF